MKVKLTATIPTAQYANISPEIEVEAETYEQALEIAESRLTEIWNKYVEPGKELKAKDTGNRKLIKCFAGGEIFYDEATHTYTNEAGKVYLSASQYAESLKKPFDKLKIANLTAKRDGVEV